MTKIIVWGAGGKMGQIVCNMAKNDESIEFVCGIDKFCSPDDFNYLIYNSEEQLQKTADVIIDFSRPDSLPDILKTADKKHCAVVLATTGYSQEQIEEINTFSKNHAVFMSYNMSLGINLMCDLIARATKILHDKFDIEIIEKHHNQKVDSPSGTAMMLANAANSVLDTPKSIVYGRHGNDCLRGSEIGIHAVRGGTIVGQHDAIFAGHNETITISHQAESREILASGAIAASKFIKNKKNGLYNMKDMFK